jgi:hypothetical protein
MTNLKIFFGQCGLGQITVVIFFLPILLLITEVIWSLCHAVRPQRADKATACQTTARAYASLTTYRVWVYHNSQSPEQKVSSLEPRWGGMHIIEDCSLKDAILSCLYEDWMLTFEDWMNKNLFLLPRLYASSGQRTPMYGTVWKL